MLTKRVSCSISVASLFWDDSASCSLLRAPARIPSIAFSWYPDTRKICYGRGNGVSSCIFKLFSRTCWKQTWMSSSREDLKAWFDYLFVIESWASESFIVFPWFHGASTLLLLIDRHQCHALKVTSFKHTIRSWVPWRSSWQSLPSPLI